MKDLRKIGLIIPIAILMLTAGSVFGGDGYIDLAKAVVVASPGAAKAEAAALETLREEID